jgi:hypothetical protein
VEAQVASPAPDNPSDGHRNAVLRHLYHLHRNARGMQVGAGFKDIAGALHGRLKGKDVASALDYLDQVGWVVKVVEPRQFQTATGTVQSSPKVTYKISHHGIDRMERSSVYRLPSLPTTSIVNIGGVTTVGDHNIVNTRGVGAFAALSALEEGVKDSGLSDTEKLTVIADVGTIKAQLAKPNPSRDIVRSAWSTIEALVTAGSLAQLAAAAANELRPVLQG